MGQIVLDQALRARLNGMTEEMQVRDESGQIVGYFVPAVAYNKLRAAILEVPFSKEAIDQFRNSGGAQTLEEIWKHLGVK